MTEAQFADWLREKSPRPSSWTRIETWTTTGFPDLSYSVSGYGEGLFELKIWVGKEAPKDWKDLGVRKEQRAFLLERVRAGGKAGVLVRWGEWLGYFPGASPFLRNDPENFLLSPNLWEGFTQEGLHNLLKRIHLR